MLINFTHRPRFVIVALWLETWSADVMKFHNKGDPTVSIRVSLILQCGGWVKSRGRRRRGVLETRVVERCEGERTEDVDLETRGRS